MAWRPAKGLVTLRDEVNAKFPNRSKAADGTVGDTSHKARPSDHNPNSAGVVCAMDITHDPKNGFNSYDFADWLRKMSDARVNYIISNGRIANSGKPWRKYTGSNAHDHHVHVSLLQQAAKYDNAKTWNLDQFLAGKVTAPVETPGDRPVATVPSYPLLYKGIKSDTAVRELQGLLNVKVDGSFGPATERAVKAFQTQRGLTADGKVGFYTWQALKGAAATGQPQAAPSSTFDRVMEYILPDEGAELNISANEPGGASRYGVSIDALTQFLGRKATIADLKALTPAVVAQVYRKLYADPINFDRLPIGFNYAALDFGINSGIAHVDGKDNMKEVEDAVLTALQAKGIENQINKICDLRLAWMKTRASYPTNKKGWTARVERVRNRALNLAK